MNHDFLKIKNRKKIILTKQKPKQEPKNFYLRVPRLIHNSNISELNKFKILPKLDINNKIYEEKSIETTSELSDYMSRIKNETDSIVINYSFFENFSSYLKIDIKQLRIDTINYIVISWNRFYKFILNPDTLLKFKSKEDYLHYMNSNKYNDYILLFALCELYQLNATIKISKEKEPIFIKFGSNVDILIRNNL